MLTIASLLDTLIAPVVIAGVIAQITTVIIAIMNNQRLRKMEIEKTKNQLDTFRYTKLYELLVTWDDDMESENEVNNKDKEQKIKIVNIVTQKSIDRYFKHSEIYKLSKPLLDEKYIDELDKIFKDAQNAFFEVALNMAEREKLEDLAKLGQGLSEDHDERGVILRQLHEKLMPMENKLTGEIVLGIDIECEKLVDEFSRLANRSQRLQEIIQEQLSQLITTSR